MLTQIDQLEYDTYFGFFIQKAPNVKLIDTLVQSQSFLLELLNNITEKEATYTYEVGKWSIKEIVSHLVEVERIFNYKSLRYSRKDFSKIPGFEPNDYVLTSNVNDRNFIDILKEFNSQRINSIDFYNGMNEAMLQQIERLDGTCLSVRAIGYFISGHTIHHTEVIKKKYLKN